MRWFLLALVVCVVFVGCVDPVVRKELQQHDVDIMDLEGQIRLVTEKIKDGSLTLAEGQSLITNLTEKKQALVDSAEKLRDQGYSKGEIAVGIIDRLITILVTFLSVNAYRSSKHSLKIPLTEV